MYYIMCILYNMYVLYTYSTYICVFYVEYIFIFTFKDLLMSFKYDYMNNYF